MTTMQSTTIAAYPVVQPPVIVQNTNPNRMNVEAVKGLAITQIVIGVVTLAFGIGSIAGFEYGYWVNSSGSGIWFGIWVLVTGIIGLSSSKNPASVGLNGTNMGFNIVCTVVSFFVGIFYVVAVVYYANCDEYRYGWSGYYYRTYCQNKNAGLAIYVILLIAMISEFFISMVAAIFCCQGGCCGASTGGVIIQPQQPGFITTGVVTSNQYQAYPASYPQPLQAGAYPVSTGYPPQQQAGYPQYTYPGGMPHTNITYSSEQQQDVTKVAPPPPYSQ